MNFGILPIMLTIIMTIIVLPIVIISSKTNKQKIAYQFNQTEEGGHGMKYCSNCGAEIHENAVVCVKCGCAVAPKVSYEHDIPSTGLNILSFFFPLIGLILYLVFKNDTPIKAKALGKCALIGFIIGLCLEVFGILLLSL